MNGEHSSSPIAIVGVAALFPGSVDKHGFWRDILGGRDLITDVPASHWLIEDYYDPDPVARDKTYAKRGAFLGDVPFDTLAWGIPPSNVPATDTAQLLGLIVAQQVLDDACQGQFQKLPRERASVILGVTSAQELLGSMVSRLQRPVWVKALREQGLPEHAVVEICDRIASHYVEWQESTFPGVLGNVVAGRIANRLDLRGTNCVTDAACASSLSALAMGVAELRLGESDLVISGGVDVMNDIFMYLCFSKTPALSPTGDCRPFSDQADGTLLGEGIGLFALQRLADAERDGRPIYAVIKGIGSSSDGRAKSVYAPLPAGQALALRRAYAQAGYGPETVGLVEAHGTGTKAGDAAEFEALRQVFEASERREKRWCALGSVKSQVGHTKAAAGAAGLFKATLALSERILPPTIKVERPDPKLRIEDSPFYLNTVARPWVHAGPNPRRAAVSAFGFGGANFHVTLEEYTGPRRAARTRPGGAEAVLLGASSSSELAARCSELAEGMGEQAKLASISRNSQVAFQPGSRQRLLVLASSSADLRSKLERARELVLSGAQPSAPGAFDFSSDPTRAGLGFVFPGQGSQFVDMGAEAALLHRVALDVWGQARAIDFGPDGQHLDDVVYPRPAFDAQTRQEREARLKMTEWAQPAIGAVSLSLLAILRELGVRADAVLGHSFGELTALGAAGVLAPLDVLRIARLRGELMARAAHEAPGAMTSVAASLDEIAPFLFDAASGVVIANHNAPRQVVLSGPRASITRLEGELGVAGLPSTRLDVACAFHSPAVSAASAPLREFLDGIEFRAPTVAVYGNASAAAYPTEPDAIRDCLARQLSEPVRFVEQVEAMYRAGIRTFLEVGPGSVLTQLIGQILAGRPHRTIALLRKGRTEPGSLSEGLGRLSVAGVSLDYERLWSEFAIEPEIAPSTNDASGSAALLMIRGSSYGKPYPPRAGASAVPGPNPEPSAPSTEPASAPEPVPSAAWLEAWQESQRQTAECHATFQRTTADAHAAFLRMAESSLASARATLEGRHPTALGAPAAARESVTDGLPAAGSTLRSVPAPARGPAFAPPTPRAAAAPLPSADLEASSASRVALTPPPAGTPHAPSDAKALSGQTLEALAIRVVARCTGYPPEMLGPDMDLEGDLGVDSIKRVEILSALRKEEPRLPELGSAELGGLRTLRQIAARYLEALGVASSPSEERPVALGRWALRAELAPAPGLGTPGLFEPGGVVVTDDGSGVGAALVAILERHGARARRVDAVPPDAAAVIFLGGLRAVSDVEQAMAVNAEAFRAFRAVAARFAEHGGTFVSVQDTGGDFGLGGSERAWLGGLTGLAKTAAVEWPRARVRALDIDCRGRAPAELADALWAELREGGEDREVGLRPDSRSVLVLDAAPLHAAWAELPLDARSVVVVSGGGRGVTSASVLALARRAPCRFLLLGRTALEPEPEICRGLRDKAELMRAISSEQERLGTRPGPGELGRRAASILAAREISQTLAELRDRGAEARYAAVDVSDAGAVASAFASARAAWGAITGIVHGAGVLADRSIAQQTDAEFDLVFRTKVLGLRSLLQASAADELRFLFVFSSVVARAGNRGQGAYALSNEVLNKVAALEARRRGPRCRVRALGFGPIDGGMVDAGLRAHFRGAGVPLIPLAAGAEQLPLELARTGDSSQEVLIGLDAGREDRALEELQRDVLCNRERQPFLDAHRIEGVPVVPVTLVLEWFARAVRAWWPEGSEFRLTDVHVRRGIRLYGYDAGETQRLCLRARRTGAGASARVALELVAPDGTPHYAATAHAPDTAAPRQPASRFSGSSTGWTGTIYGPAGLFHGPEFQTIQQIQAVSDRSMLALLANPGRGAWPGLWRFDPALLDGGLQLALLWGQRVSGRASLPTAIGAVEIYAGLSQVASVLCLLSFRDAEGDRLVSDVTFSDANGQALAEMRGIVTHLLAVKPGPELAASA